MPKCIATTANGPCNAFAMGGSDRCRSHLGPRTGRKTLLDDDVQTRLASLLRAGNYVEVACAAVGITSRTFRAWLERGDPEGQDAANEPYRAFREAIDHARAEGEARNVALIAAAAPKDWRAAAWVLERSAPERWGRIAQRAATNSGAEGGEHDPDDRDSFDSLYEADELAPRRQRRAS